MFAGQIKPIRKSLRPCVRGRGSEWVCQGSGPPPTPSHMSALYLGRDGRENQFRPLIINNNALFHLGLKVYHVAKGKRLNVKVNIVVIVLERG